MYHCPTLVRTKRQFLASLFLKFLIDLFDLKFAATVRFLLDSGSLSPRVDISVVLQWVLMLVEVGSVPSLDESTT